MRNEKLNTIFNGLADKLPRSTPDDLRCLPRYNDTDGPVLGLSKAVFRGVSGAGYVVAMAQFELARQILQLGANLTGGTRNK